jgi:ferredoxin
MPTVHFVKQNVTVQCPAGANLRQVALANGIDLYVFPTNILNCRGFGLCGTCRVKVSNPRALSARTPTDKKKTGWEGPEYRLSCQTRVLADVEVITSPRKVLGWMANPTYQWMEK